MLTLIDARAGIGGGSGDITVFLQLNLWIMFEYSLHVKFLPIYPGPPERIRDLGTVLVPTKGGFLAEKSGEFFTSPNSPKNIPFYHPKLLHPVYGNDKMSILKKCPFTGSRSRFLEHYQ